MKQKPQNSLLVTRVNNEDYIAVTQMAALMNQSKSEFLRDLIALCAVEWRDTLNAN